MSTLTVMPSPVQTFFYPNGSPVAQGQVYFYAAGTTTLQDTYSDAAGTTKNTNPLILDGSGKAQVYFLPTSYRVVVYDSVANGGALIWDKDNIASTPGTSAYPDVPGTAGEALTAGTGVYLSDGSGGKTAGRWYKWDTGNTYSSTTPDLGVVVADLASGALGSIRLTGQVTGLTALTAGTDYYVGPSGTYVAASGGGIRFVGRADSTTTLVLTPEPSQAASRARAACDGRLTLVTQTPVTSSDVTAATTLYFTPYLGNQIGLYVAPGMVIRTFTELSIAVPATTSQMYDVFVYDNGGTPALELQAWTNDTTRASALDKGAGGVYFLAANGTRRYVGSFRTTTVSGQTEDSATKRYVWNYYHRDRRPLQRFESTSSWTYTTATVRQANGSTSNQVEVVVGLQEATVDLALQIGTSNSSNSVNEAFGIGEDSTTTFASGGYVITGAGNVGMGTVRLTKKPAIGRHYYSWNEYSAATGTSTWYGTGGIGATFGLAGWIEG